MDYYFANKQALIDYLKGALSLAMDSEGGYYGETTVKAIVTLDGDYIADDSIHVSGPDYHYCDTCNS